MDAVTAQLVQSLSKSVAELAVARAEAAQTGAHLKYAELTGRIETMRTVIQFFQQAVQAEQAEPATGENPPPAKTKKAKEAK